MNLRIKSLREKRGTYIGDMEAILEKATTENRAMTDDESKAYGELKKNLAANDNTLKAEEEMEHLKAMNAKPISENAKPVIPVRARYGKLINFVGEGAEERAYRSGMWAKAAIWGDDSAKAWCAENGIALQREKATQSEGVNTAGGFLVPDEFLNTIIDLRETYGVARREMRTIPMARDTVTMPRRTGGLTAYFTGEGAAITKSAASWDAVSLTAKKLAVYALFSSELAEDAIISIADTLAGEIAYAFAEKEDDCLFNGTGAGGATYGGIQGILPKIIDGTHTAGAVDPVAGVDTFAEVTAASLTTLMAALPQYALERGASFYCSQAAWAVVFQRLVAAGGGNTIDTLTGRVRPSYLGYPIVISQKLPTTLSTINNTVMLLFGNLAMAAMFGDRRGVSIAQSEHIKFIEDQIAIRGTERFDINVHDLGDNTTAGPLVALIGNT